MAKNDKKKLFEVFEKVNKLNLKEWYDDEYYQKPIYPKGMGKFENIDWRVLFDTLVDNYYVASGKKSDSIGANYGDLTDNEGMLSPEELQHLEAFGLVEKMGAFPVIGDQFGNFDAFYNKAKEIWNQEAPVQGGNDSEIPFLRGNEPMSENDDYDDFPHRKYTNESLYEYVLETMLTFKYMVNTHQNLVLKAEIMAKALEDRYPELRR